MLRRPYGFMQWSSWEAEINNISAAFTNIPFLLGSVPASYYIRHYTDPKFMQSGKEYARHRKPNINYKMS